MFVSTTIKMVKQMTNVDEQTAITTNVTSYKPARKINMLLSDSESRRNDRKRHKSQKKRKYEKIQKRASIIAGKELEPKDPNLNEALKIHELLPVPYKTGEEHLEESYEEQTVTTEQDTGTSVTCVDAASNSNKFVIITLLEPEDQEAISVEPLLSAEHMPELEDKSKRNKQHKKVILLHKIDTESAQAIVSEDTDVDIADQTKDDRVDFGSIPDEFATTDMKDQRDISSWIKRFHSLTLLYTESGKPYTKCPACTAMFFKVSSFEKHISSHLQKLDDRYVCSFCTYSNEDPSSIFTHLYTHQDQCEVCNMNLTRKNSFKKHWDMAEMALTFAIKRDRFGRFVCVYCKLGFDLCHQLQKHWFRHSCNSRKTYQCNNCSGLYDTLQALENHICLKCPVCNKICESVHRLRSHTRYEKHYLYCTICSYEFILAIDHEKHLALHKKVYHSHKDFIHCLESEDGNSFQCEICGKIFQITSSLVLHLHDDHKIAQVSRALSDVGLERMYLPEDKDNPASSDLIDTLKDDLKCGVEFERACEEVLVVQTERVGKKTSELDNNDEDEQCEPVALCWNRYSIGEQSAINIRKAT